MKNYVVESYENYREEERLSTNNARRIEFITTVRALDELIVDKKKILDCAAGTGAYAFYLADKGHDVTATDITPRHIEVIKEVEKNKTYKMDARVLDATDMSIFENETFDVVLNMGPFYHLIHEEDRKKCFEESLRVLKKGGLLITTYIPRYYVFQYVAMQNDYFLDEKLAKKLTETGVLRHDDEKCFWTDTYYSSMFFTNFDVMSGVLSEINAYQPLADAANISFIKVSQISSASSILFVLPLIILYVVCNKAFVQGVERSGIVG